MQSYSHRTFNKWLQLTADSDLRNNKVIYLFIFFYKKCKRARKNIAHLQFLQHCHRMFYNVDSLILTHACSYFEENVPIIVRRTIPQQQIVWNYFGFGAESQAI